MTQSKKKPPLVSIIIPVFNGEKTIQECLESVLSSDHSSFEVLLVDDGSTDTTLEIVKKFNQVKVLTQENRGSAAAKNLGAKFATGNYCYFLDSDVIIFKDTISMLINTAETYDVDMVMGRYSTNPMNDDLIHHYKAILDYVMYLPKKYRDQIKINHQLGGGGEMISKRSFLNLGGFNEVYRGASVEREELWTRFYEAGYRSAANPMIQTRHYFPGFKSLVKNYALRIYATIELLNGKKAPFTYMSKEKTIVAPLFSFISILLLVAINFQIVDYSFFLVCVTIFAILSRQLIGACFVRHGFLKAIQMLGIHFFMCLLIFFSGTLSYVLVKTRSQKII
jgi:glycosyltransferase involved in cell wall biosynthesis